MKFLTQHQMPSNVEFNVNILPIIKTYEHIICELLPYSDTLNPNINDTDYFPYGSTQLSMIAYDKQLKGLHLNHNLFNYRTFIENRDDMLNAEYIFFADEAIHFLTNGLRGGGNQSWFMRPAQDSKHFTGIVNTADYLADQLKDMVNVWKQGFAGTYGMHPSTEIVLAEPKLIQAEWRWFIVDKKIVSGTMYKCYGKYRCNEELDSNVINEAQTMANKWLPDSCCVMDTALVNDELKVIEFNCINSSGFYKANAEKIITSIAEYHSISKC